MLSEPGMQGWRLDDVIGVSERDQVCVFVRTIPYAATASAKK
jgi:hypothetical protein